MIARRSVLQWSVAVAVLPGVGWSAGFSLQNATLRALGEAMASGKTTSRALCEAYLQRIAATPANVRR